MKKFSIGALALALALIVTPTLGKSGFSSSFSSSSSSRSFSSGSSSYSRPSYSAPSPSSSYSKPAAPTPTWKSESTVYSKPSVTSAPVTSQPAVIPKSILGSASAKKTSADSLAAYQKERSNTQFAPQTVTPSTYRSDPIYRNMRSVYPSPNAYMTQRTVVINRYHTTYPQSYAYSYGMYPNYGHWDSGFLMGILIGEMGHNNAMWMYSHQSDPWYGQWRQDVERQANDNADLKAKLADMDKQVAELKAKSVIPDPGALPEGIDPTAAIAPEAILSDEDDEKKESYFPWGWILGGIFGSILLIGFYFYNEGKK